MKEDSYIGQRPETVQTEQRLCGVSAKLSSKSTHCKECVETVMLRLATGTAPLSPLFEFKGEDTVRTHNIIEY